MGSERLKHTGVIFRIRNGCDIGVVLGRCADHRRTANVDVLDNCCRIGAAGDSLLERIKIDHRQIDLSNGMLFHCRPVLRIIANGEQPAMHARMQGLDPPIHDFRKRGQLGDVPNRKTGLFERDSCATGRNQLDPGRGKPASELDQSGFVRNRKQGPANAHQIRHRMVFGNNGHGNPLDSCRITLAAPAWINTAASPVKHANGLICGALPVQ